MNFRGRQNQLRQALEAHKVELLLVTHLPNVRYLCGFTGSAGVLLGGRRTVFFTDGRYATQAAAQVQGARISIPKHGALAAAAALCARLGVRRVGIEADHLTVSQLTMLERELGRSIKLVRLSGVVEALRAVKDEEEIELTRKAVALASGLFPGLLRELVPGAPENRAAAKLESLARRAGAEGMSFDTIVAGGERSALPHGVASGAPLPEAGFVVLDYGVVRDGYCSDMTRTVHIGKAGADFRALYEAVLDAQLAAISTVRPGVAAGDVDQAARKELKRARLDRFFTHSTGHGVGLEIHEMPRIGAGSTAVLQPGMIITIEPGIYLPGRCGIRIEDMLLVTETGYEVLTPVSKALIELDRPPRQQGKPKASKLKH